MPKWVLKLVAAVSLCYMSSAFAFNFGFFGDGPLRPCESHGFCNKFGAAVSSERYSAFLYWDPKLMITMFICFVIAFGATWIDGASARSSTRDSKSGDPPS